MAERSKELTMTEREPVIRLDEEEQAGRETMTGRTQQDSAQQLSSNGLNDGNEDDSKKMSRAEAGRKGGLSTKKRYGDDYFRQIGRMGGKKGGEATKRKYGVEFYQEIGRKGGSK